VIRESHRAFVRAVVDAARANGMTRVSIRFGASFADEITASWDAGQNGGKIRLSAEEIETIDPEKT
jgi:hypothetical protein